MTDGRPSWLTVALAGAGGFLCGVLLVAILGGPKGTTKTETRASVRTVTTTRTVTRTETAPAVQDGVPDVVGQRLDDAQKTLEDAGYDVDVQDGTLFGVVEPENFVVTGQDPKAGKKSPPDGRVTLNVQRG